MGEPVPIRLLAEQMIRLAGKQPGRDIAIVYTGLRPGEKLHETLFHADERYRADRAPEDPAGRTARGVAHCRSSMRSRSCAKRRRATTSKRWPGSCATPFPSSSRSASTRPRRSRRTVVAFPARNARKI